MFVVSWASSHKWPFYINDLCLTPVVMNTFSHPEGVRFRELPLYLYFDSVVSVVVQFYPWLNFYFSLFYTHYHTLPYTKTN